MKVLNRVGNLITFIVCFIILILIATNLNVIFPALNQSRLITSDLKTDKPIDIPSDLNYLNNDKKKFLEYCRNIYGDSLPYAVDSNIFFYYGSVDGVRLYRLQCTLIPYEHANQEEAIGGFNFTSDGLYRPARLGLYVVSDDGILSLEDAYSQGKINIADIYQLYHDKTLAAAGAVPKATQPAEAVSQP